MDKTLRKRALVVYSGFLKNGGGVVTHAYHLKELLEHKNVEAQIFAMDMVPSVIRYIFPAVERAADLFAPPYGFELRMRLTKQYFRKYLPKGYDYYFFEDFYTVPDKYAGRCAIFIHSIKCDDLQKFRRLIRRPLSKLENMDIRLLNQFRDSIYVVSEEYKKRVESLYGIEGFKVFYNFISREIEGNVPWEKRDNNILFIGNFEVRKNPLFLLDAARCLKNLGVGFKVYFIGREREITGKAILEYARKKGLEEDVVVSGMLKNEEVMNLMKRSKVLALPSLMETFGYVLLEGKLCGCHVLASRGLDVPGDLVDMSIELDPELWAGALEHILKSRYAEANKCNKSRYGIGRAAEILTAILDEIETKTGR